MEFLLLSSPVPPMQRNVSSATEERSPKARVRFNRASVFKLLTIVLIPILLLVLFGTIASHGTMGDEGFHWSQIKLFLEGNWKMDPSITNIPGFHFLVTLFAQAFAWDGLPALRAYSMVLGSLSIIAFYLCVRAIQGRDMLLRTYQYVFLPILFPFFFLLYTDPTSQLFVLFGLWAAVSRHAKTAALFAILSVCIRQTNIIWLFFLLLYVLIDQGYLDEFFLSIRRHASRITVTLTGSLAKKSWKEWFWTFWVFGLGLILFAVFVKMNGGVAIGDKGAHPFPAFHLGNVYFLLFCFFCLFLPINIANLNRISEMIAKRKLLWLGIIIAFFIFYMLTFVNDHYNNQAGLSFFLRNKILVFYTKTEWHKAVFFLPILYATLSLCVMRFEKRFFYLLYPFTLAFIIPSWLIEQRYYLVPFAIFLAVRERYHWTVEYSLLVLSFGLSIYFFAGIQQGKFFL
jgi:alpha-1,2-glucosyltransferase